MSQYIHFATTTPAGAETSVHRIHRVELNSASAVITVNSYIDEESELLAWQEVHTMPLEYLDENITDAWMGWLISPEGPFAGGQLVDTTFPLEVAKKKALATVAARRDQAITGGCNTVSGVVDTDDTSVRNILGSHQAAVLAKLSNAPFSVEWRIANNTMVPLNADAMIGMGDAVMEHIRLCYQNSWALKAAIEAATNLEELAAVDIGSGWPYVAY